MSPERPTSLQGALVDARLSGRHGDNLSLTLEILAEDGFRKPSEIQAFRDAYAAGSRDRATGQPCMCRDCVSRRSTASEREGTRTAYWERRSSELRRAGVADDAIGRQVEKEIAQGAAEQERPVVIRRASGEGDQ